MIITYLKGDATQPIGDGKKIIAHICNDVGAWGRGFVLALSKQWENPETEYRKWFNKKKSLELGEVQFVKVYDYLYVANMIAQHGILLKKNQPPPIRYDALENALEKVVEFVMKVSSSTPSVHMPKIGTGLAAGKWELIEPIIQKTLVDKNIKGFIYEL